MKIVFAASEVVPYCKTGGLADVAGALPKALVSKGARVTVIAPYYREVRRGSFAMESLGKISVPFNGESAEAEILRAPSKEFDCLDGAQGLRRASAPLWVDDRFSPAVRIKKFEGPASSGHF